jgi:hypothetical protein
MIGELKTLRADLLTGKIAVHMDGARSRWCKVKVVEGRTKVLIQ